MLARTMKMTVVALALGATVPTFAETLAIDGQVAIKPAGIETPQRGSTMSAVTPRHTHSSDTQVMKETKNLWDRART